MEPTSTTLGTEWAPLRDPALVQARQGWERRLCAEALLGDPLYLRGINRAGSADLTTEPDLRLRQSLDYLAEQASRLSDGAVFRPLSVNADLCGVHFVDRILGANVFELHGETNNWQARTLSTPVGELPHPDLDANPMWTASRTFAEAFVRCNLPVPVFSLPTIASALNIGLNLYGEELLIALLADPEDARRDLALINDVLLTIHDWYRRTIPQDRLHQVCCGSRYQPPGCGQICGCSTQLVSAEQYRHLIAPLDDAILASYPGGGMIHLCGTHTQHIETWKRMESLRALQLNDRAAEDLEIYLQQMPERIYYVHPCEGMPQERVEMLAANHRIVIVLPT